MKQERLQALGVKELQSNPVKMLLMLETLLWRYIAVGGKRDLSVVPVQARATCYNPTGFNCNCTSVNFIPYLPWKFPESEMQLNYLSSSNESPFPDGERMLLTSSAPLLRGCGVPLIWGLILRLGFRCQFMKWLNDWIKIAPNIDVIRGFCFQVGKVLCIQKAPRIESPRNRYDSEDSHSALTNDECLLWIETEDVVSAPTREIAEQLQGIGKGSKIVVYASLGQVISKGNSAYLLRLSCFPLITLWLDSYGGQRSSNFLHLVTEAISGSGLLDRLVEVQKLDNIDIEGAIHAYYNLVCQPCIACRDLGGEKLSARYAYLHSMSSDESLKIVRDYLIAATAKDLSLMISFRSREDRDVESPYNGVFIDSTNQRFEYKVAEKLTKKKADKSAKMAIEQNIHNVESIEMYLSGDPCDFSGKTDWILNPINSKFHPLSTVEIPGDRNATRLLELLSAMRALFQMEKECFQ
ncbi:hypothetical protein RHMOL_Rhmol07G0023800 [Rhododendron molle]|uniref:Uncharacterized protein n=1 Tax=Rhododendron molle TaxID=49168 RepID=A0ACC0MXG3_RHOML|nr:hypothetical protein RHMOL_Rhmol07G0023800 [Rhododendron molle]